MRLIVDNQIDLEISIDYSGELYAPDIQLNKKDANEGEVTEKGVQKKIITDVKPSDIEISVKHFVKYKFVGLKKDNYALSIIQNKPKDCNTKLQIELNAYKPLAEQTILEQEIFGQMRVFTAQAEIQD